MAFKKVDPKLNLPEEEKKILDFWRENKIFQKTLDKKSPKGNFVFYEGPPTANGQPGLHHVEARSFKDLFCRYKTMQGYYVKRKAGWDTHGLPVELSVEKELGISGKPEIENIVEGDKKASIEKFNKLCRESVWKYKTDWEKLTERMAYWLDMEDPYITYDPKYIESVWNVIAEAENKGLLYKGHKVVPYCTRCGTALSSHEVAQGYKNISEESVYLKIKSTKDDIYFLVWTTTPWTLAGNAALALGPNIEYSLVEKDNEKYILSNQRVGSVLGSDTKIIEKLSGKEIVERFSTNDNDYEPLYPDGEKFSEAGEKAYKLILGDFVTDSDGTGIVHIAPAFGEDDYETGFKKQGVKVLKTVDDKGIELAGAGKGSWVKDADEKIKADLESRGILFKKETTAHDYPFCWRCDTPLLYFARDSWYIAMSKLRTELLANNEEINWNPEYLKNGRFGNWLENINDWAISRDRYWGTPLPIWECEKCDKYKVISGLTDIGDIDPHKPFIDEVELVCDCGGKMKRTPEVMDVWFDSGAMPFAQYHWPHENEELFKEQYPAEFICEAVDQTRGWFYTLLAISTIVSGDSPYKNVISVGHLLDEKGKKMSKSLGNIVTPDEVFEKFGADVIRYYFYSVNQPGEPKLFSEKEVLSLSRNLFLTLWNVYSFFMTYASIDKFTPKGELNSENVLDRWILAKYNLLVKKVTDSLDKYDPYQASVAIVDFVAELSTWYVRRSRRRFWKSESDADKNSAYETLFAVLAGLSRLIAPFSPMYAEHLYLGLKQEGDSQSVHLTDFPIAKDVDEKIISDMDLVRKVVEAGLAARAEAKIKVRQPLSSLKYFGETLAGEYELIIAEEVNVKKVENSKNKSEKLVELDTEISEELKIEGLSRELIRNIQDLRKKTGLQVEDRIILKFKTDSEVLKKVIEEMSETIKKEVLANEIDDLSEQGEEYLIEKEKILLFVEKN